MLDWQPVGSALTDGTHIMVCSGPYSDSWGFNQAPPCVVHYFNDGFYLSRGIVEDSYNDAPVEFTHWCRLGDPPRT